MRCDHCGRDVPEGVFCTACGAHQGRPLHGQPHRRYHRYAAHPGEHVFQPAVLSTIFPHLGQAKLHEFRLVFLGGVAGVFVLFFAGLITAALCVATMLIPVLYLLYLYEAQVYREEPLPVLGALVVGGVGLGVGITVLTDKLVSSSAQLSFSITGSSLVIIGLVIPLIQEAVKPIPALALRSRPAFPETMDGLVFGLAAGLGFGVGETFTRFSSILLDLPVRTTPGSWIYPLISTAVFVPLLQGSATALIAAGLWRFGRRRSDWLAVAGIVVALAGHVGFSTIGQLFINHGWSPLIILSWQALVDVALLIFVRLLLHHALLEEGEDERLGEKYCPHCHHNVVAGGFCPQCGLAMAARPHHLHLALKPGARPAPEPG
jgi:RsiW-degrading membrane proteinase PrsW (M82 family)